MTEYIQDLLRMNPKERDPQAMDLLSRFWTDLRTGKLRAASKDHNGTWGAVIEVKEAILWAFRAGVLSDLGNPLDPVFAFTDKDTLPVQRFHASDQRRIVPGGTSVREGAYLAPGVIVMPPSYINVGAYVGEGSMVDSHALIGSCAQIGRGVHVSAAVQIGGVLEPINASPVVIEDDVMVGGNCGVYEGTVVRERAVLGTGVILTRSTPVYDLVRETVYRGTSDSALEIPSGAVVVQGTRALPGAFAKDMGLSIYTPIIIKYRDERTDAATVLESALRGTTDV